MWYVVPLWVLVTSRTAEKGPLENFNESFEKSMEKLEECIVTCGEADHEVDVKACPNMSRSASDLVSLVSRATSSLHRLFRNGARYSDAMIVGLTCDAVADCMLHRRCIACSTLVQGIAMQGSLVSLATQSLIACDNIAASLVPHLCKV